MNRGGGGYVVYTVGHNMHSICSGIYNIIIMLKTER